MPEDDASERELPLFFTIVASSWSATVALTLSVVFTILALRMSLWNILPAGIAIGWFCLSVIAGTTVTWSRASHPKPWQTPFAWGLENALTQFGVGPMTWVCFAIGGAFAYFGFANPWFFIGTGIVVALSVMNVWAHASMVVDHLKDPRADSNMMRLHRETFARYGRPIEMSPTDG